MTSSATILVFGVSGVGKTAACEAFLRRNPAWLHMRASDLLSEATAKNPQSLRIEGAHEIRANQALLGGALRTRRAAHPGKSVLIDAHGVIDNDRMLVPVPLSAVQAMVPDALILLEAPAVVIAERRGSDRRNRPVRTISEIETELKAESSVVRQFAHSLNLQLATGVVTGEFELEPLIAALRLEGRLLRI